MLQLDYTHNVAPGNVMQGAGNMNAGNSCLFLFTPRDIVPHYKRPITYNFNTEMTEAISEHIVNNPSHSQSVNKVMNTTPTIHQAIIPSARGGIKVATEAYSGNWMFVLIVDDNPHHESVFSNKLLTRTILIGICAQEPISAQGMMTMTPEQFINHNCNLIVTKRLQMNKYDTAGVNGYVHKIKPVVNDNIVQFDKNLWNTGYPIGNIHPDEASYFTMMPGDVQKASSLDSLGATSMINMGDSINAKGPTKVSAVLESPRAHMKEILTAIETAAGNNLYSEHIHEFGDGISLFNENKNENLQTYVKSALSERNILNSANINQTSMQDITTTVLTLGMVMMNYHPRVFPIVTPKNTPMDIIPQHYTSRNNVFSSLVCAVLPTYLNTVGLSAIGFMYNSVHEAFKVLHIESLLSIPQQELQFKWKSFQHLISTELFPVLFGNSGHFDLQVMCSVNGTTDVILNFLDFELLPTGAIYQENCILGGIVSPLVGNADHLKANSIQLNNMIQNIGSGINNNQFRY